MMHGCFVRSRTLLLCALGRLLAISSQGLRVGRVGGISVYVKSVKRGNVCTRNASEWLWSALESDTHA